MKYSLVAILHFLLIHLVLSFISYVFPSILPSCCACNVALCLFVSYLTFGFTKKKFLNDVIEPFKKAIFITGCDTGFGHNLAKRMDSKGYHVYAGCLFPDGPGASSLKESCSRRFKVVGLDVSKDESVERALEFVKENLGCCDLWAIVNNAGTHKGFSVELTPLSEFQETMDVNAFGPVRVTKAFLPLLKKSKGRVVNVTSLAGRTCIPYVTSYFMSKFAAVGFSDCLRQELSEYGIRVISIEPEIFATNLTNQKLVTERLEKTSDSDKSLAKDDKYKMLKSIQKGVSVFHYFRCPRIELVVDDLEQAISSKYPEIIYEPRRNIFFRLVYDFYVAVPISVRDFLINTAVILIKLFL